MSQGTHSLMFQPLPYQEDNLTCDNSISGSRWMLMQHISAHPSGAAWSPEEARWAHSQLPGQAGRQQQQPALPVTPAPTSTPAHIPTAAAAPTTPAASAPPAAVPAQGAAPTPCPASATTCPASLLLEVQPGSQVSLHVAPAGGQVTLHVGATPDGALKVSIAAGAGGSGSSVASSSMPAAVQAARAVTAARAEAEAEPPPDPAPPALAEAAEPAPNCRTSGAAQLASEVQQQGACEGSAGNGDSRGAAPAVQAAPAEAAACGAAGEMRLRDVNWARPDLPPDWHLEVVRPGKARTARSLRLGSDAAAASLRLCRADATLVLRQQPAPAGQPGPGGVRSAANSVWHLGSRRKLRQLARLLNRGTTENLCGSRLWSQHGVGLLRRCLLPEAAAALAATSQAACGEQLQEAGSGDAVSTRGASQAGFPCPGSPCPGQAGPEAAAEKGEKPGSPHSTTGSPSTPAAASATELLRTLRAAAPEAFLPQVQSQQAGLRGRQPPLQGGQPDAPQQQQAPQQQRAQQQRDRSPPRVADCKASLARLRRLQAEAAGAGAGVGDVA